MAGAAAAEGDAAGEAAGPGEAAVAGAAEDDGAADAEGLGEAVALAEARDHRKPGRQTDAGASPRRRQDGRWMRFDHGDCGDYRWNIR